MSTLNERLSDYTAGEIVGISYFLYFLTEEASYAVGDQLEADGFLFKIESETSTGVIPGIPPYVECWKLIAHWPKLPADDDDGYRQEGVEQERVEHLTAVHGGQYDGYDRFNPDGTWITDRKSTAVLGRRRELWEILKDRAFIDAPS